MASSDAASVTMRTSNGAVQSEMSTRLGFKISNISGFVFGHFFVALLHASRMSQTIPDIRGYSQIFPVSEGILFSMCVISKKGPFDFLGFLRG